MKRPSRKVTAAGAVLIVVLLIVASVVTSRETGIEVDVETVERRDLTAIVSASGALEPKTSVSISATTPGEVVEIAVREGDRVSKGDFLLQLDPVAVSAGASAQAEAVEAARAEAAQAEAQLTYAAEEYKRKRTLAEEDLVPRSELQAARAELLTRQAAVEAARRRVAQARAGLVSARHDVSRVTITSPIDGIVTRVNVEEGEVAMIGTMNQPGTILLTISDLGVMEATVDVDETDIVHVETGQPAEVSIDAFPARTFAGTVTEVASSPRIEPTAIGPAAGSTDFEVVITLADSLPVTRSGLSSSADIRTAEREDALSIPVQSLVVRQVADETASEGIDEREGVFIVRDGKARFVPVSVGIAGERHFEVVGGLEGGERVVAGPYQALRDLADGEPVRIRESGDGKGPS